MAPRIPIMSPEITPQVTPEVSAPPLIRPAEGAFGGESVAAQQGMGRAITETGDLLFQRMQEQREREIAQHMLDVHTQFQTDLQSTLHNPELDDNNMPKGILNRQLNQAKGATGAYDEQAIQMKQRYLDMAQTPIERRELNQSLSAGLLAGREQVIAHESDQTQKAFVNSFDTNIKSTVAGAAGISDPAMVDRYINSAQRMALAGWRHSGIAEVDIPAAKSGLASEIVKSALTPLLENDPKKAQAFFDAAKDHLTPLDQAQMQNQITGKKLDATILDVFDKSKEFRMADGMIDRSKIDAYVNSLDLSPQQKLQVKTHVDRLAMVDYSEQMKQRQDSERSFTNDLIAAQSKGIPYDQALKIPAKYGWDNTSIANMQAEVTKIYASPEEKFNTWITRQPQATQAAWSEAENIVKAKYGNTVSEVAGVKQKLSDAALTELKQDVLGKNPDQIREIVKTKLDKVVIGPGAIWGSIWPNKNDAWKVDAETRTGISEANAQLEKDYGADQVGQARAYLASNNLSITPKNIKAALDKALEGKK